MTAPGLVCGPRGVHCGSEGTTGAGQERISAVRSRLRG
jgi:hypothetical protein